MTIAVVSEDVTAGIIDFQSGKAIYIGKVPSQSKTRFTELFVSQLLMLESACSVCYIEKPKGTETLIPDSNIEEKQVALIDIHRIKRLQEYSGYKTNLFATISEKVI